MSYKYPKGHPCEHCPYKFNVNKPSCTMGSNPKDCVWRMYHKMNGITEKIDMKTKLVHKIEPSKIERCIEKLINVGEAQYGPKFGEKLRSIAYEK